MINGQQQKWKAPSRPQTEEQFQVMMHSVDNYLSLLDVRPAAKSLFAMKEICAAYRLNMPLNISPYPQNVFTNTATFSDQDLLERCRKWYETNLNEKGKEYIILGHYVLLLRNQFWKIRVPVGYGTVRIYANKNLSIDNNVLMNFEALTQDYANTLTDSELKEIMAKYCVADEALNSFENIRSICITDKIFLDQAYSDYISSVEALISFKTTYGKSRRDTATCCEKILKGILNEKKIQFKKTHNIPSLALSLNNALGTTINLNLVQKIHTEADVSYDKQVTKLEAYEAHKNLLIFLCELGNELNLIQ